MMKCLNDGTLLAFLDEELEAAERRRAAQHLAQCAVCRQRSGRLKDTAARVNGWLDGLDVEDVVLRPALSFDGRPSPPAARRLSWGLVLVFCVLLLAVLIEQPKPRPVAAPVNSLAGFVPLDDDPVQVGVIVRMKVSPSALGIATISRSADQVAADVIIGEDGRARAIRFLE